MTHGVLHWINNRTINNKYHFLRKLCANNNLFIVLHIFLRFLVRIFKAAFSLRISVGGARLSFSFYLFYFLYFFHLCFFCTIYIFPCAHFASCIFTPNAAPGARTCRQAPQAMASASSRARRGERVSTRHPRATAGQAGGGGKLNGEGVVMDNSDYRFWTL